MEANYVRLPGRGKPLAISLLSSEAQRLFLSDDHLLVLRQNRAEESHKKFNYKDIQAVTVQSNSELTWILSFNALLLAFIIGVGIITINASGGTSPSGLIIWGFFIAIPLIFIAKNLIQGKTCSVRLHTAVQVLELTSLRRIGQARSSLEILRQRIEAAQGQWQSEEMTAESDEPVEVKASGSLPRGIKKETVKVLGVSNHRMAFVGVVLLGITNSINMLLSNGVKDAVDALFLLVVIGFLFTSVIRQHNSTLPDRVKSWSWVTLVGVGITYMMLMYVDSFVTAFNMDDPPDIFEIQSISLSGTTAWHIGVSGILGVTHLFLGALGLLHLRGYKVVEEGVAIGESSPGETDLS